MSPETGAVEGMVFEARGGWLYWTSASAGALRAARVGALLAAEEGAPRRALVRTVLRLPAGARPRALDLDPCRRRLYWTNWNDSAPAVQRAYTSGRALQTLVSTAILMPNGLALDHRAKKLYWADARLDKIERMDYDGSHRQVVTQSSAEHPFDVAVAGDWVFWTDWVAHGVFRVDKRTGEVAQLRKDVPRPMAIVAIAPSHQTCEWAPPRLSPSHALSRFPCSTAPPAARFERPLRHAQRRVCGELPHGRGRPRGVLLWGAARAGGRRALVPRGRLALRRRPVRLRRGPLHSRRAGLRRRAALRRHVRRQRRGPLLLQ